MPIEVLGNQLIDQANVISEVISQNQRFILGAKLESSDFQFIPLGDEAAFAILPEGVFFTDINADGLNRYGRIA